MDRRSENDPRIGKIDNLGETSLDAVSGMRANDESVESHPETASLTLNSSIETTGPSPTSTAEIPGDWLRAARIASGMDTASLAKRLRLSEQVILDLEANRFDRILPTFARGYLRSIAYELNGPADEWVAAYDRLQSSSPVFSSPETLKETQETPSRKIHYSGILKASFLIVVLAGIVYAWNLEERATLQANVANWLAELSLWNNGFPILRSNEPEEPPTVNPDAPEESLPVDEFSGEDPLLPEEGPIGSYDTNPLPPSSGTTEQIVNEGQGNPTQETDGLSVVALEIMQQISFQEAPVQTDTHQDMMQPDDPATSDAAVESPPAAQPSPIVESSEMTSSPPPGHSALSFSLSAQSWIEVRSASGRTVVARLFQPGELHEVVVETPATVIIGNAPGVTLQQNGQPVPLASRTQSNNTARITLTNNL